MSHILDSTDKAILNLLQDDATLPLKTVAERVHVSVATAQRRIQALIDSGVITKQVAIVNPNKVGYGLTAVVMIEMERSNTSMQRRFERLMDSQTQVMSCYEVSGDFDFMLMVNAKNMSDYHQFTRSLLTYENNVRNFKSQFVMNFTKSGTKITLD
ncbi:MULTISPECIES: Lrp/AsnC family transcriptional regulator [Psychrobacter]|jgi:Lrp/AsnC family leucine-responsive transcriptional regulator|uniref:Lrp/AsnC family transcriptional regulator n=1 Tax=Psychrobacter pocilloporae TaxID=1775882 RepID=A0ABT6IQB1_9GAMM|nr:MULTISPECIES: Lrp/AsnC family transcriptional regulator [Psychrobacter]MED6318237.1 Lrp/AsnC family transcriptional regulator [Pseudomonadota bacterium]HBL95455.1 Lrp/AsnC family transcriptional regulator [Psychrobacter sp.]AOY43767.1 putative transcriptional regulator [Psychrobacter sp. AntiMn-1]MBZ1393089.1 Lrp/AsnC family transcriptional regulator [Psychrobacter pacificensis]MDH4904021.1 Lrp/AsnC family transcriptional regulator [Psychrobacter pocilloporae]|tara:strand:+ start:69 stop:536 length:468 start_codon:yes stop_codon:yes gene_type:complete